jgi:hexosaminidase
LVDLQSFPFVAPHAPELAGKAAFSSQERYTTGDVKAVVAFAADLGIRVVVEVDVPGHTRSFCDSHPEVCPTPDCGAQNALAPNTNATFELIAKVFTDIADATTDRVMHLGGDEVQYSCWNNSAAIRRWITEQPYGKEADWAQPCVNVGESFDGKAWANRSTGMASCVFQDFILRAHMIAAALNRTATGWHEIWRHLGTRLPKSTIIHFWLGGGTGLYDMRDATANGYRAVWSIARGVGLGGWYTGGDAETWATMYISLRDSRP